MKFRTPSKVQVEAIECGAVATWIILGYYGKWITSEEARAAVNITKDGSSAFNIATALRNFGFESEGFQPSIDDLKKPKPECQLPCVAWINKVHWVVLEGFDGEHFYISDPARGHRKATADEFSKEYAGLTISAVPTPTFEKSGNKPNPLTDVINLLAENKSALITYIILGGFATVPTVGLSSFVGFFTDTIIEEKDLGTSYIWVLVLLVGLSFLFKFLQAMLLRRMHLSMLSSLIRKTIFKLVNLPLSFYPLRDLGEISQRITLTVNLSNILTGPLASAAVGIFSMIIYLIIMLSYNPLLGAAVVVLGGINLYALVSVAGSLSQLSMKSSMCTGKMTSNILYIVNNFQDVKKNGQESPLFSQWSDNFCSSQENSQLSSLIKKRNASTTSFLNQLADYLIVIFSGIFILRGALSLGEFMSFRLISLAFLQPINSLAGVNSQFSNAVGDINRLKDLWDAKNSQVADSETENIKMFDLNSSRVLIERESESMIKPSLSATGLSFRYNPGSDLILENIKLELISSDIISLSGPPGCGKTTLLNALACIEPCIYEEFTLGKRSLNEYSQVSIRNAIGYITQSKYLFDSSIYNNITVFDSSITSQSILKTAKIYGLIDALNSLPNGLQTQISSTSSLSNSTKVVIHILRSLVRNPSILFIDDIFSNLDTELRIKIFSKISSYIPVVLVVTKDPILISMCSRSLILNKSNLVEITPTQLVENIRGAQA